MKPNMHPFSSKKPEPHSPSNVSGTLGTAGSSCSGRSSRGRAYVPRHGRIYAASLFLGQKIHLGLCALLGMAIICLTYLFAGEGAWMFVVTEQAVELGSHPTRRISSPTPACPMRRHSPARHLLARCCCRSSRSPCAGGRAARSTEMGHEPCLWREAARHGGLRSATYLPSRCPFKRSSRSRF